jgi:copper chaperone
MMETVTLKINGMTCAGCARSVTKILEGVEGVRSARVSLERGEAIVELDRPHSESGRAGSLAALKAAVEGGGYEAA